MIKIAICDDERELREATAARLREYFAEEALIAPFESGEALLRAVREENCRYQLAVLDIELGEMNGIAVGEALNRLLPTCQIIYLTGYLDYAPDAYATRHTYYVYRPTMEKHLPLALQKAMTALAEAENGQLVLPQKGGQLVLEKREILPPGAAAAGDQAVPGGRAMRDHRPEAGGAAGTAGDPAFLRCHNSFAVSLDHAAVFRRESFLMRDGTVVPISHGYYPAVREQFRKYHHIEL